jgi:hypothetical protein
MSYSHKRKRLDTQSNFKANTYEFSIPDPLVQKQVQGGKATCQGESPGVKNRFIS